MVLKFQSETCNFDLCCHNTWNICRNILFKCNPLFVSGNKETSGLVESGKRRDRAQFKWGEERS